jgi:putative membrane protein
MPSLEAVGAGRSRSQGPCVKFLFWIFYLPLVVIVAAFAIANRGNVSVSFDPLPYSVEAPLYTLVLSLVFAGTVLGAVAAWLGGHRWRSETRTLRRRNAQLAAEVADLRDAADRTQARGPATEVSGAPGPLPPAIPAPGAAPATRVEP